jgi:hypothetical protein
MRSRWTAAFAAFAMLGLAPQAWAADEVQAQMQQMEQRLQQMEDRLQATDDQLDAANQRVDEQSDLIESSGLAETRGASSGLGCFMCELTIGGWVAGSYFYNTQDPNDDENPYDQLQPDDSEDGGGLAYTNTGLNGAFYPLHPDHNSFSLDQVWWEIEREISEENRGGFRTDFVYGKTATFLNGGGPSARKGFAFEDEAQRDDSALYIHQAYVQYLAPVGDGLTLKFGKFATLFGTEVAGTVYNWQITRGNVWNLLEPIDHYGVLGSYAFGDSGFDAAVGGINGFAPDDPDRNDQKSIIGHVGWAGETVSAAVNTIWGNEAEGNDGDNGRWTVNGLVRWDPSERFGMWLNGDWARLNDGDNPTAWGVALAGRYGITERTGVALRGEYVADQNRFLGFSSEDFTVSETGVNIWGVTGTVDHLLTDHLMVRAEARWDMMNKDNGPDGEFFQNDDYFQGLADDQIVVGLEVVYNFSKFSGE